MFEDDPWRKRTNSGQAREGKSLQRFQTIQPLPTASLPSCPLLISAKALFIAIRISVPRTEHTPQAGKGWGVVGRVTGTFFFVPRTFLLSWNRTSPAFPCPCLLEISIRSGTLRIRDLSVFKCTSFHACFSSTYTKIGTIQRLAWPLPRGFSFSF